MGSLFSQIFHYFSRSSVVLWSLICQLLSLMICPVEVYSERNFLHFCCRIISIFSPSIYMVHIMCWGLWPISSLFLWRPTHMDLISFFYLWTSIFPSIINFWKMLSFFSYIFFRIFLKYQMAVTNVLMFWYSTFFNWFTYLVSCSYYEVFITIVLCYIMSSEMAIHLAFSLLFRVAFNKHTFVLLHKFYKFLLLWRM